ncbi:MAG: glycosyltransferase family 2 protein [bacterium]|nr:glycosyltransferase family 2 protein [bacterium]
MAAITIAVPTFNRRDAIVGLCRELVPLANQDAIALLVIDNGSSDGTWQALQAFRTDGVTLVREERNTGFSGAVASLVDMSTTDYVMLTGDDDRVDVECLPNLLRWLAEIRPDFVSTSNGSRNRYVAPRITGPMSFWDFRDASAHAPGLIFSRKAIERALPFLLEQLDKGNVAAIVYPQALLAAWTCIEGSAWWLADVAVWEVESLPARSVDPSGLPYWAPRSRLSQALGFNEMLMDLSQRMPSTDGRARARKLYKRNARTLYPALRNYFVDVGGLESGPVLDSSTIRQLAAALLRRMKLRR